MDDGQEIRDRVRRIETRVTKIGNAMGIDVGGGKPVWDAGRRLVSLPSPNCSIKEIVESIPDEFTGLAIDIYVGVQHFATLVPIPHRL